MEQRVSDIFTDREKLVKKYNKDFIINQASAACSYNGYRNIVTDAVDILPDDSLFTLQKASQLIKQIVDDSAAATPKGYTRPKIDRE